MELKNIQPEITESQRLDQNHKENTDAEEISKADFSSESYISTEEKLSVGSFGKAKHKG